MNIEFFLQGSHDHEEHENFPISPSFSHPYGSSLSFSAGRLDSVGSARGP